MDAKNKFNFIASSRKDFDFLENEINSLLELYNFNDDDKVGGRVNVEIREYKSDLHRHNTIMMGTGIKSFSEFGLTSISSKYNHQNWDDFLKINESKGIYLVSASSAGVILGSKETRFHLHFQLNGDISNLLKNEVFYLSPQDKANYCLVYASPKIISIRKEKKDLICITLKPFDSYLHECM